MIACAILFTVLAADSPELRAAGYLAQEVPLWFRENQCFSCHNDGDGARALYQAKRRGYPVPSEALAATTAWLSKPAQWESNRGSPVFSDKKLARVQFAAALLESGGSGLDQAAAMIAKDQDADGAWHIDADEAAGSPATYGAAIATYLAKRILETSPARFRMQIDKAKRWLETVEASNTPAAAAVILGGASTEKSAIALRWLVAAQGSSGGWGPYASSPAEAYDTALAVLALDRRREFQGAAPAIERGRAFLIANQLPAGGWIATTRPPGGQSYAQHVSTTAWAAMALLATDPERNRD